ncbi:uncharacterized protein CC84DRAFT_1161623 [Paraphaeosphaeria sporulosa]|uniref:Uncharacterized protein n=1 Tax=Paraphaeosphaeria sporulosa TaxID=1460663 RepID=A0A177CU42_9PLEO|nr:uncharacterized protein CC84DRAFT_1161623 [Paraphaeosphaeria sporulosa]OAG10766.1 hypothetical protein CC84DRAFT_1161623 [Paraphaeosphaeria sporulosa]
MVSGVNLALEKLITYFTKLMLPDDHTPSLYCVATAIRPSVRLSWFKTQWKAHPVWHKAAEKSIRDVYKQYLAAEKLDDGDLDELPEVPRTRKVPGAYASDERRLRTMLVDDHLLTGKKGHKRQKLTSMYLRFTMIVDVYIRKVSRYTVCLVTSCRTLGIVSACNGRTPTGSEHSL